MKLEAAITVTRFSRMAASETSAKVHGLPIVIEYPKGSLRELKNDAGKTVYKKHMYHSYGYIKNTTGRDSDGVDCFLGPMGDKATEVYVAHMRDLGPDKDEREDEDKVMLGFGSHEAAKQAFLLHYPKSFLESMSAMPVKLFKERMRTASMPYRRKKIQAGGPGSGCRGPNCGRLAKGDITGYVNGIKQFEVFAWKKKWRLYRVNVQGVEDFKTRDEAMERAEQLFHGHDRKVDWKSG